MARRGGLTSRGVVNLDNGGLYYGGRRIIACGHIVNAIDNVAADYMKRKYEVVC
jgi:hypothetical protein